MKKIFSIILCAAVVLMTGCAGTSQDKQYSYNRSVRISEYETSLKEAEASREAEIEEVDEWGIALDDVDRLAKQAIRRHENVADYRKSYYTAIGATDKFLEAVESGKAVEYSLDYFIKKYDEACSAGIEYMEASIDVEFTYNMYTEYGEFTRSEKDNIRFYLTMFNSSFKEIEQSQLDMKTLLNPIIEENRKLTGEELKKVFTIYQILTDKVDIASSSY